MSNQSTYYELWTEWSNAGSGQNEKLIGAIQPIIAEKAWASASAETAICAVSYEGTLIQAKGMLVDTTIPSSPAYYVDIQTDVDAT